MQPLYYKLLKIQSLLHLTESVVEASRQSFFSSPPCEGRGLQKGRF